MPLSVRGSYNYEKLAYSSRIVELPNAVEMLPTVALKKRQGTESNNTYDCTIFDINYTDLLLEGYSSRTKQWRNFKLRVRSQSAKGL